MNHSIDVNLQNNLAREERFQPYKISSVLEKSKKKCLEFSWSWAFFMKPIVKIRSSIQNSTSLRTLVKFLCNQECMQQCGQQITMQITVVFVNLQEIINRKNQKRYLVFHWIDEKHWYPNRSIVSGIVKLWNSDHLPF